ncbi:DNA repair protein RecO [Caldalkalibacillus salinus]|uniref:DNA repair protein RecO n=1 Tax=Caldalkalibacillus salinus TaxID=2803787 RepID=UPI001922510F|nr:DNA repair protein RecO [Caldalkalibacillus salinus]
MLIKIEGLIIKTKDYGEGNKILTVYTREAGKISLMARGAKKPKSRLSSVSQLFTYGHYMFYRGTAKGMGTLSQGDMIESFRDLRQDLTKTSYAAYFADLLHRLTEEHDASEYIFQMIIELFKQLEDEKDPEILARLFELKMLVYGGYRPELSQCVSCGATEGTFSFSVVEGGFLCHRCTHMDQQRIDLTPGTFKVLRLLSQVQPHQLGHIKVKTETKTQLREVLWHFMDQHTPLRLKTRDFLEQMSKWM